MRAKLDNIRKYRDALVKGEREGVVQALNSDFGSKENARVAMAYIACAVEVIRLENRIKIGLGFGAGVLVTLAIGAVVRVFAD